MGFAGSAPESSWLDSERKVAGVQVLDERCAGLGGES
jgi:hypothetical protein